MAIQFGDDRTRDRVGRDVDTRLKMEFLYRIAASPDARWPQHLARFVAGLAASGIEDTSVLQVLLSEVRRELRAFAGLDKRGSESNAIDLFDREAQSGSSIDEMLARFEHVVSGELRLDAKSLPVPDIVREALRFIEHHYAEPITIAHIASAVGRSRKHLGVIFRQHTGSTVHEYLTRTRLRYAVGLIRNGDKIEAVSLLVGYRSKKNFYRHFKAQMGCTPLSYRRALLMAIRDDGLAPSLRDDESG
jgi:AraC-like DNA-binding protein